MKKSTSLPSLNNTTTDEGHLVDLHQKLTSPSQIAITYAPTTNQNLNIKPSDNPKMRENKKIETPGPAKVTTATKEEPEINKFSDFLTDPEILDFASTTDDKIGCRKDSFAGLDWAELPLPPDSTSLLTSSLAEKFAPADTLPKSAQQPNFSNLPFDELASNLYPDVNEPNSTAKFEFK